MNNQEREYFDALHNSRVRQSEVLSEPSLKGLWHGVINKYSDQAHFVYELIQNADDAGATSARFVLYTDRLVFAHNGTRHFSITDPADEENASKEGRLGDLNSITGIAFLARKRAKKTKLENSASDLRLCSNILPRRIFMILQYAFALITLLYLLC